ISNRPPEAAAPRVSGPPEPGVVTRTVIVAEPPAATGPSRANAPPPTATAAPWLAVAASAVAPAGSRRPAVASEAGPKPRLVTVTTTANGCPAAGDDGAAIETARSGTSSRFGVRVLLANTSADGGG